MGCPSGLFSLPGGTEDSQGDLGSHMQKLTEPCIKSTCVSLDHAWGTATCPSKILEWNLLKQNITLLCWAMIPFGLCFLHQTNKEMFHKLW